MIAIWVAFNAPAFFGHVLFPIDYDRANPPESLVAQAPAPANPLEGDAETLYYPLRSHVGQRLAEGDLPLWDPHRFAGAPLAANSQAAVFYPPTWFFALGDTLAVYSWTLVLSRLVGMLLFYWFMRQVGVHPWGSALGAVVFIASGFLMAWGVHITFVSSAIWLPLALGGLAKAHRGQRSLGVALGGLGLGLAMLGGHPQVALYVWLGAAIWAAALMLAAVVEAREHWLVGMRRVLPAHLGAAAATFALGTALAAVQILSAVSFSGETARTVEPYDGLVASASPERNLLTFLLPDLFGNPLDGNHLPGINYTEAALYAGLLTLPLAAAALWHRRNRYMGAFAGVGAVGLLVAFGTPAFLLLYHLVPGMDRFRGIGRAVFLVDAALAGLAGLGVHALVTCGSRAQRTFRNAAVVVAVALASLTVASTSAIPGSYLIPKAGTALALLALGVGGVWLVRSGRGLRGIGGAGLLLLVIATDLRMFGARYHPFQAAQDVHRTEAGIRYLSAQPARSRIIRLNEYWIPVNAALVHDLYDVQGYDNFIPSRFVDLISLAENQHVNAGGYNVVYNLSSPELAGAPALDLLGVRSVLAPTNTEGLGPVEFAGSYGIFRRPGAFPPAFLTGCWRIVPPGSAIESLATMDSEELRTTAIIDGGDAAARLPSSPSSCRTAGTVRTTLYQEERVRLQVEAERDAILVLTDNWEEGWEASVDGAPIPTLRVDHALRGVAITPGDHEVEFVYRPDWLVAGMSLTGLGVVGLGTLLILARREAGRRPTSDRSGT